MNITGKCKKEITEYLYKKGWIDDRRIGYYYNKTILRSLFVCSKKGYENNLYNKYIRTDRFEDIDKYFLEYIGFILKKYKIKKINICYNTYQSIDWKFDNIKKIK